ncbi:hypothetical protein [Haloarcula sp. JP-L23]|uniref:hypothetical protein n=1 Tax=Haloarcula sp. JP-L23 TaxID=2716717 RepID=UPI00140EFE6D|nr:hypothetical protein G9465_24195 [Haloarcula sp. JP-L23]
MSDKNHNRRRILKTIGIGAVSASAASVPSSAKETTTSSNNKPIQHDYIEHDLEVFNRLTEPRQLTISIAAPGNGRVLETFEIQLDSNDGTTDSDGHLWTKEQLPTMNGPMTVTAQTEDEYKKTESVYLPPQGKRQFQALSITIANDRLIVGQIET